MSLLSKITGMVVMVALSGIGYAAQQSFSDDSILDELSLDSAAGSDAIYIAGSGNYNAANGSIILAQSSTGSTESVLTDSGNSDVNYENAESEEEFLDQYTLPRSAAPVAVDSSIQTTSPIGRNTQDALTSPPGVHSNLSLGFFPAITIGISRTDNPAREPGQDDVEDSSLKTGVELVYRSAFANRHLYEVGVSTGFSDYDKFTSLDSESWTVFGAVNLDITEKVQADIYANHTESSDPRGSTATRIIDANVENDEYETDTLGGSLTLGRRSNPLQLVLEASNNTTDYTNNNQDSRDRETNTIGAGLHWNVGPRTSLFLNLKEADIDYDELDSSGFNSTETSATVGAGWAPTFHTSLVFQVGNLEKDLADPLLNDYDGTTYDGRFRWSPSDRTGIGFYASQTTEETTDRSASYILTELVGADISHSFTNRFRGSAYINSIDDEIESVRDDEILDFGVGVFYDLARWITLGASWSHIERESTDPQAEYESNTYSITATIRPRKTVTFDSLQTSDELYVQ